jgi:hypothetical protein
MAQDRNTAAICSSAETEDWLSLELAEQHGCRIAIVEWCHAHARAILALASIGVWSMVLIAAVFG